MEKFRYIAWRDPKDDFGIDILVEERQPDGTDLGLPLKQIVRHSPTGMEWGYGGSGPADTALSILTDFIRRSGLRSNKKAATKMADGFYMDFKWKFIAPAEREGFQITDTQIRNWLNERIRQLNMDDE
jgi:hypothetical protein